MSCPDYFNQIRIQTEHLGDEIHQTPSPATPFYNMIERGVFEKNTGVEHTTFNMGRVEPTSKSDGWSDVSLANNLVTGAACVPNFHEVGVGYNEVTYAPRKLQLKGPSFCRDTLTFAHNPLGFIGNYVQQLAHYAKAKIDLEFRNQVVLFSNKMSIAANAFNSVFTGTTLPTLAPTSQLTWDWLDGISARLIRDGATSDGATIDLGPFGPIHDIYIGLEMQSRLFSNVPSILASFQYAYMGKGGDSPTLQSVGQSLTVKNYRFNPVTHPPRADYVGGILVEREAFENTAATSGTQSTETSAYRNAEFEAAIVTNKRQWKANVVSPDNAGLDFDAGGWTGEWQFVTGGERIVTGNVCYDPLHRWGAHFAEFLYAPEPIHTNYGWVVWFRRCQNNQGLTTCTSSYV